MKLKIDTDFKKLIPPLTPEEFGQLEQNILSVGKCRNAIVIWKDFIVDGHNRHTICQEHGIHFDVNKMHFKSKKDALIWIAENQLGRRNLTDAARIELACFKGEMLRQKAKENQSNVGGDMRDAKAEVREPVDVRKEIAAAAGVGERTVYKYMKIVGEGAPELVEQVRKGEVKIGTAYNTLKAVTRKVTVFFDDEDVHNKGSMYSYANVLNYIDSADRLYGFLDEVVLYRHESVGMSSIKKKLEGQLEVVERLAGQ